MEKKQFMWAGLLFLLLFIVFSYLVHKEILKSLDYATIVFVQASIPKTFDVFLSLFSLLGSVEIIIIVLLLLLYKNLKQKTNGALILFLFALASVIEILGKKFVPHLGPPLSFFRYTIPFVFPSANVRPGYSYPSGHAFRTVFLAIILMFIMYRSRRLTKNQKVALSIVVLIFTFIILLSRISLGEHWMSDVIGGGLLGMGFGFISLIFL